MEVDKLGSYNIVGTLGVGAMGVVYKAVHDTSGKTAAVKVISAEIAQRGKAYERFKREAEILQQFRHPNIVRILAVGKSKGISYFAMEYIKGKTLEEILKDRGALDWKLVVELGKQICDALHYAHEHGVVHRDLKPSNLMITDEGRVKLTDFGIAKDLDATALTATGRTMGTAAYMAPEQIRGTPDISHKTDLYSLGIVFYQMLTGDLPFEGNSHIVLMHAHMHAPVPRARGRVPEIPKALDDLVFKLMNKDVSDRPWDAAAVGEVLLSIREKANKAGTVAVDASDGPDAMAPTQGMTSDSAPAKSSIGSAGGDEKPKKKKIKKTRPARGEELNTSQRWRKRLETVGLLLVLCVLAWVIYNGFRPWTAEEFYQRAETLMASEERGRWSEAVERYINPLDLKYPDNPYKEKTRAWRDQLLLKEAEERARYLESSVPSPMSRPNTPAEERFVAYYTKVAAVRKAGADERAALFWDDLAAELKPETSEDARKWLLYSRIRAQQLRDEVDRRRKMVIGLLNEADMAAAQGRAAEAENLRRQVRQKFGAYQDALELMGPAPVVPTPPPAEPSNALEPSTSPGA